MRNLPRLRVWTLVFAATLTLSTSSNALAATAPDQPQDAAAACSGLREGDTCAATVATDEVTDGSCRASPRSDGTLACVPSGPPGGGPPAAAIDACAGLAARAACTVALPDGHALAGVCQESDAPSGAVVACRPDGPPPPSRAHFRPPQAAVSACDGGSAADACSFADGDHSITGTCRPSPDGSGSLACAPDPALLRFHP